MIAARSWGPTSLTAQELVVPEAVRCSRCSISVVTVVTLGSTATFDLDLPSVSLGVPGTGGYLTTGFGERRAVNVFDGQGRHIGVVGRQGRGPGEYSSPTQVTAGPGDSIWVLDRGLRRLTLSAPSGAYVDSWVLDRINPFGVGLVGSQVVVSGFSTDPTFAGASLYALDRSTGTMSARGTAFSGRLGPGAMMPRVIASLPGGTGVWSAPVNSYRLEYSPGPGGSAKSLRRDARWYPDWVTNQPPIYQRSSPSITGLQMDRSGRLWVFIAVTREGFRPQRKSGAGEGPPLDLLAALRELETVIEVIDPIHGHVISRRQVPYYLSPSDRFPFVMQLSTTTGGDITVNVAELALVQPHGSEP